MGLFDIFKRKEKDIRLTPDIVRIGDTIRVWLDDAALKFAFVECRGNDPVSRKMLVKITWDLGDGETRSELRMLAYNKSSLVDFHVLNAEFYGDPYEPRDEDGDENVFDILRNMQAEHERLENYEKAAVYKTALETLQTIKNK